MELCSDTGNKAACYHMGRYFEKKGDYKQAIAFFQQASAVSNAMRLCRVCHPLSKNEQHFIIISVFI